MRMEIWIICRRVCVDWIVPDIWCVVVPEPYQHMENWTPLYAATF
jgi:hypothetical protein